MGAAQARMKAGVSQNPVGTVLIAVLSVLATFVPVVELAFVGERSDLAAGEWWRLWTAHWVHFAPVHLLWSGLVWLVAASVLEVEDRILWLVLVVVLGPLIVVVALMGDVGLARYGGLSGLATAATSCLGVMWLVWGSGSRRVVGGILIGIVILKIIGEWERVDRGWVETLSVEGMAIRVALWAHVAGFAGGVCLALGRRWWAGHRWRRH